MDYPDFSFETLKAAPDSRARLGRLTTPHGSIETPSFIFCATKGAIKGLTMAQMRASGAQFVLANTYHLMIAPGPEVVAQLGGLHKMTGWDGPLLTDSGGFQIFSMGHGGVADEIKGRGRPPSAKSLAKITEEGATFRSYLDGKWLTLTPERSVDIQRHLGPDFVVVLDECTPFHVDKAYTKRSMDLSHRWGDRSLTAFREAGGTSVQGLPQALYGIVQGGVYPDLRAESSKYTSDLPFFGTAIGGSLGADKAQMYDVVGMCTEYVHPDRPIHLLGIGGIQDIFAGIRLGMDTFDCVSPTRVARHGWALMKGEPGERINIRNQRFRGDNTPLDAETGGIGTQFSRGYVHHLIKSGELTGMTILVQHNVEVMVRLMEEIRRALAEDGLDALEKEWLPNL